jgi:hypothetical protein
VTDDAQTKQEDYLRFVYKEAPGFRTIHVDGALGGVGPRPQITMAVYSESFAPPSGIALRLNADGTIGEEVPELREGVRGVVRYLEANLVMDGPTARAVHAWLGQMIEALGEATGAPTKAGG